MLDGLVHRLGEQAHCGKWSTQLVGDMRDKILAHSLQAAKLGEVFDGQCEIDHVAHRVETLACVFSLLRRPDNSADIGGGGGGGELERCDSDTPRLAGGGSLRCPLLR